MKKEYKKRLWFDGKYCYNCKKPGTAFLYFNENHQYIICDNPHCDYMARIKAGFFAKALNIKGVK